MIAEQVTLRKQVPSQEGMWLYQFVDNRYNIAPFVWLGKEADLWEECDEEQKATFEAHNAALDAEMEAEMNNNENL